MNRYEQRDIRALSRGLCLRPHATGQGLRIFVFKAGGVDNSESQPEEIGFSLAAVARYTGAVIDKREALANKPIEQG